VTGGRRFWSGVQKSGFCRILRKRIKCERWIHGVLETAKDLGIGSVSLKYVFTLLAAEHGGALLALL
jgi:hypothetical protein